MGLRLIIAFVPIHTCTTLQRSWEIRSDTDQPKPPPAGPRKIKSIACARFEADWKQAASKLAMNLSPAESETTVDVCPRISSKLVFKP